MLHLKDRHRSWLVTFFLVVMVAQASIFSFARPVYAIPVEVIGDAPRTIDKITNFIKTTIYTAALGGLLNAVSHFANKLAYDTASYLAAGGKGQGALVFKDGIGSYLGKAADSAAGELIDSFGAQAFGVNLCQIPDLKVNLLLKVGFRNLFPSGGPGGGGPQPNCTFSQFRDNWSPTNFENKYGSGASAIIGNVFNAGLKVEESDFGVGLSGIERISGQISLSQESAKLERLIGNGVKDVFGPISGKIVTPSAVLQKEIQGLSAKDQKDLTLGQIGNVYLSEAPNVLAMAASVFLNTLGSQLLGNIFGKPGLFPETPGDGEGRGIGSYFEASIIHNRDIAQQALSFLLTPTFFPPNNFDVVAAYRACPDSSPGLNNCVMDEGLQQAVDRGKRPEDALTIEAAMKPEAGGLLHGNWKLIPPERETDNASLNCYSQAYCYSNIQKLRRVRILPVGFEIAALLSDPDNPWTLQTVVKHFDDCNANGQWDRAHPYCHLIDPKWILKAPEAQCRTKTPGPILAISGAAARSPECVDIETCLAKDEQGCTNWGYCLREKNVWKLPGKECQPYYATCTTYQNTTNPIAVATVSYLSRTVDYGECSDQAVGCLAYSAEQANGEWSRSVPTGFTLANYQAVGRNPLIHFNNQRQDCRPEQEGCSIYYQARRINNQFVIDGGGNYTKDDQKTAYLKKAPDYLGCYDTNPNTLAIDWPRSRAELANLPNPDGPACGKFAAACAPEEAGCENYTAVGSDETIPAIIGAGNFCPQSCVGYSTFKQEASIFEAAQFPKYFIPSKGTKCEIRDVGCDQFTNIEVRTAGGETPEYFTRIKYCEKPAPDGSTQKIYYSWEGSEREGYVLKVHALFKLSPQQAADIATLNPVLDNGRLGNTDAVSSVFPADSPAYADLTKAKLEEYYRLCNTADYRERTGDCRALYDDQGHIFYRLLAETVTVSPDCHRLRKTDSRLYDDTGIDAITDLTLRSAVCGRVGGSYNNNKCLRCFNGGRFESGQCLYQAITTESSQCSSPAANGCRAYTGSQANNVNTNIIHDQFEPVSAANATAGGQAQALIHAKDNWSPAILAVVSESVRVGEHSLSVNTDQAERSITANQLRSNANYLLTFWSRGTPQSVLITFVQNNNSVGTFTFDPLANTDRPVTITSDWRQYRLGPIPFTGDSGAPDRVAAPVALRFARSLFAGASGPYYLDEVRLEQLPADSTFQLIKDSWRKRYNGIVADVPLECDSTPNDAFPGAALGCAAYTDSQHNTSYVTNFASLCREKAVGCQPVFGTHNTVNSADENQATAYNVWCQGAPGQTCTLQLDTTVLGSCAPAVGTQGCFVPKVILPVGKGFTDILAWVKPSTIFVPADAPTPVFLTNTPAWQCTEQALGCQQFGQQDQIGPGANDASYHYNPVWLINNPAAYEGTLCRADLVGCGKFAAAGSVAYFKDPEKTGHSLCVYKDEVVTASGKQSGWFRADSTPCDPSYLLPGNEYGIWSHRSDPAHPSSGYKGFVGVCDQSANLCTELIDPAGKSSLYPEGKPYYQIYDDRLTKRTNECNAQVSQKEGCVLFNRTDRPNKTYSAAVSYANSQRQTPPYGLVPPVSAPNPAQNDSNIYLKVLRDRECSEWLACSSRVIKVSEEGPKVELCQKYRACEAGDGNKCTRFADHKPEETHQRLTAAAYAKRDVSWNGADYSGYSLVNKYPVANYVALSLPDQQVQFLAYEQSRAFFAGQYAALGCAGGASITANEGKQCGEAGLGRCITGRCVYPIDEKKPFPPLTGTFTPLPLPDKPEYAARISPIRDQLIPGTCKVYPETDSPFPSYIAPTGGGRIESGEGLKYFKQNSPLLDSKIKRWDVANHIPNFDQANVCMDGNCSCIYDKYTYKNSQVVDYWTEGASKRTDLTIPQGVCNGGGSKDGVPCTNDSHCIERDGSGTEVSRGVCSRLEKVDTHHGVLGFCLEYDQSRLINGRKSGDAVPDADKFACLTWLPIQTSAEAVDLVNGAVKTAGYDPTTDAKDSAGTVKGGEVLCAAATNGVVYDAARLPSNEAHPDEHNPTADSHEGLFWKYFIHNITKYFTDQYITNDQINFCNQLPAGYSTLQGIPETYTNANCLAQTGAETDAFTTRLYKGMQAWAWKKLGLNATVVRVEVARGARSDAGGAPAVDYLYKPLGYPTLSGVCPGKPYQYTWHLLPMQYLTYSNVIFNTGRLTPIIAHSTYFHPPRPWDNGVHSSNYFLKHFNTASPPQVTLDISAVSLSPDNQVNTQSIPCAAGGAGLPLAGETETYRADFEADLLETRLDKVYFVPIRFQGLRQHWSPKLLSDKVNIPIKALRTALDTGQPPFIAPVSIPTVRYQGKDKVDSDSFYDFPSTGVNILNNDNGALVWAYALRRGVGSGLLHFDNYRTPAPGVQGDGDLLQYDNQRNQIQTRYVVVYSAPAPNTPRYGGGGFHDFQAGVPTTDGSVADPFTFDCSTARVDGSVTSQVNWFAIGLDFNDRGEFLGYISRSCAPGINLAVIATLSNQCTELAKIYDSGANQLAGTTNKAWTQRVWKNSQSRPGAPFEHPLFVYGPQLKITQANQPFGSLLLGSNDLGSNPNNEVLREAAIFNDVSKGIPYSCAEASLPDLANPVPTCAGLKPPNGNYAADLADKLTDRTKIEAYQAIDQLFIKVFAVQKLDINTGLYTGGAGGYLTAVPPAVDHSVVDTSVITGERLTPPQLYSLNPFTCKEGARGPCVAGEPNNFTINDHNGTLRDYNGDTVADEDRNGDGEPEPLIDIGAFSAGVKFFAWADDNRMPLRQVVIDWGDEPPDRLSGLYKNHKPVCAPNDTDRVGLCLKRDRATLSSLTCRADAECAAEDSSSPNCLTPAQLPQTGPYSVPRFGNAERACIKEPFEYNHTYGCNASDIAGGGSFVKTVGDFLSQPGPNNFPGKTAGFLRKTHDLLVRERGLADSDTVCVFQPKLQLRDNWGWCNGSCTANDGCYGNLCETDARAWTPYQGLIIVLPPPAR